MAGRAGNGIASGEIGREATAAYFGTAGVTPGVGGRSVAGAPGGEGGTALAVIGVPSMLNFSTGRPTRALAEHLAHACLDGLLPQLILGLVKGGGRCDAALDHLDDVVAELGLDGGLGELSWLEGEGRGGEFRHHVALLEETQIAAVLRARVLAILLGEGGEVGTLVELVDDLFRLVLGGHQDVLGMHLGLAGFVGDLGIVFGVQGRVGHRRSDVTAQDGVLQHLVGGAVDGVLDYRVLLQAELLRLDDQCLAVDHLVEQHGKQHLRRHRTDLVWQGLGGFRHVAEMDLAVADLRD